MITATVPTVSINYCYATCDPMDLALEVVTMWKLSGVKQVPFMDQLFSPSWT